MTDLATLKVLQGFTFIIKSNVLTMAYRKCYKNLVLGYFPNNTSYHFFPCSIFSTYKVSFFPLKFSSLLLPKGHCICLGLSTDIHMPHLLTSYRFLVKCDLVGLVFPGYSKVACPNHFLGECP